MPPSSEHLPPVPEEAAQANRHQWRGKVAVAAFLAAGALSFSAASGIDAVALGHPERVTIAGQEAGIKPAGQDYSNIDGLFIFEDHKTILGKDIGLQIDADLNNFVPQNKQQRTALQELWQDPAPAVERIQAAGVDYIKKWGGGGAAGGLVIFGIAAGIALSERHKQRKYTPEELALLRTHNRPRDIAAVTLGGIVASSVYGGSAYAIMHNEHHTIIPETSLAGTPLAGTEARGLAQKFVPVIVGLFDPRQKQFYDQAEANLKKAIADRPDLQPDANEISITLGDDPQSVGGILRLMGVYGKETHASSIYLTGDLTDFGTAYESYIIDNVSYYSEHIPVLATQGPHETDTIIQAEEDNDDFTVADNKTHDTDGLLVLGLNDPRKSTVGQFGTTYELRDPDVTVEQFITDAVQEVCDQHPQLTMMHDHDLAEQIITQAQAAGCPLPMVLTGRSYNFVGPQYHEAPDGQSTTELILGSSGGHIDTDPHPGIIESTATFVQLLIDSDTSTTHYVVISLTPEGKLTISQPIDTLVSYADYLKNGQTELANIDLYKNKPNPPAAQSVNRRH
jgi:hypothetical protein